MKKCWMRLMALTLCLLLCMPAVQAEQADIFPQRLEDGNYLSLADMAVADGQVYFLVYQGDGMQLWRWDRQGETRLAADELYRASNFSSMEPAAYAWGEEGARYAIGTIFSDGERLMAVNPLNGLVFEMKPEGDGVVFTDVVTLAETDIFFRHAGEDRWYSNPTGTAVCGGSLYWFSTGWDAGAQKNTRRIVRYSLTDGAAHTLPAEECAAICAGPQGKLILLNRAKDEQGNATAFAVQLYDPATDSLSEVGRIASTRSISRIAWCESLQALIWQEGTTIVGMELGGEKQRYAYVPGVLNGSLAVADDTLVFATSRMTVARRLVPGLTAPQSLQTMNSGYGQAEEAFAAKYPDVPIEVIRDADEQGYLALMEPNNGGERLDALRLYTDGEEWEFASLLEAGMLMDLSGDEEIAAYVEALYPPFRELVTGDNGEIWAIPTTTVSYTGFFVNRGAMQDMGFTEEDMPRTLVELCAFISMWDAEYADRFPNYCCIEYATDTRRYLTDMAVTMWIDHCQATGAPLHFDDPAFREVLEAIAAVSTVRTDAGMQVTNPEISDYKTGLFWIDCQLVGNWAPYMEDYSDRIFIPLTLTADTDFHAPVQSVGLWVVNAKTESAEYAVNYIHEQIAVVNDKYAHVLLTNRTEAVPNPYYAQEEAYAYRQLGEMQMQLISADTPEKEADARRIIARQEEYIATDLRRSAYEITPSAVDNYVRVIAPAIHIRRMNVLQHTAEGANALERTRDRWLKGLITTEQFVRELDARLLMIEMAQ